MTGFSLPARVERTIRDNRLFEPGDTVVVALSGGADSCAMLDILARLPEAPRLVVAHLNHCLRGAASDGDEAFAADLARHYSLPFVSRRIDVLELARRERMNLEEAGRTARIGFLEEVRLQYAAAVIALAHHADDQAETVLMRLLRGSGTTGLAGMPYKSADRRIRPLLDVTRRELETYLTERSLHYREDASNRDTTFLRNRIRHELLPLLARYNPQIGPCLARTAGLLADEDRLLEAMTQQRFIELCSETGTSVSCTTGDLIALDPAIRRRLLRLMIGRLAGSRRSISHLHVEAVMELLDSPSPHARLNLPHGVEAQREYGRLILTNSPQSPSETYEVVIDGPGHYPLPGQGCLTITPVPPPGDFSGLPVTTAWFDPERVPFPWQIRTFRDGDRITPLGMSGSKKLKDLFIDAKIPQKKRRIIPLIFSGGVLIWVCGVRLSAVAGVNSGASSALRVEYTPG